MGRRKGGEEEGGEGETNSGKEKERGRLGIGENSIPPNTQEPQCNARQKSGRIMAGLCWFSTNFSHGPQNGVWGPSFFDSDMEHREERGLSEFLATKVQHLRQSFLLTGPLARARTGGKEGRTVDLKRGVEEG